MAKNVWQAMKDAAGTPTKPTAREVLGDLFGTKAGTPDTTKAANKLGVSRRTIQRWIQQDKLPANAKGQALAKRHQRWENESKAGQAKVFSAVADKAGATGLSVQFRGKIAISSDRRNGQSRSIGFALSSDEVAFLAAAGEGGRADLHAAFEHIAGGKGFGGSVQLDIDDLKFT